MKKIKYCLFILFIFFISLTSAKALTCSYKNGNVRINCNINNSVLCSIVTDKKTNYTSGFNKLGRSNFIHEGELNCNLVPYLFVDITENMSGYTISCLGHSSASCSSQYMTFKYDSEYSNKYNEANPEPEKGENKGPNKIEGGNNGGNTINKGENKGFNKIEGSNIGGNTTNKGESTITEKIGGTTGESGYDTSKFCTGNVLNVFRGAGYLLFIVKIIVPILLIIFGSIDLAKAIIKSDDIQKSLKAFAIRAIAGILIFFIPSIVDLVVSLVGGENVYRGSEFGACTQCLLDPDNTACK